MQPLITQVLWTLNRGGAERMVFELAKRLPAHGFRVRVVAAGGGGVMEKDFREAHIPLHILPAAPTHARRRTLQALRRELRGHWPNVLHTHLGGDIWAGMVAMQEGIHPWLATIHDVQRHPWFKHWLRGRALGRADEVVCISNFVQKHVAATYGRVKSTQVIRLGVDIGRVRRPLPVQRLQRFVVIGRLVADKRVDMLIQALSAIQEAWHLDIVGTGPEHGRLLDMVDRLKLRPRVRFVGSVADVSPYLLEADVCLFASKEEGQGLVVLEAAAAGVPVVATDLLPIRELFDERSMWFVPPQSDVQSWVTQLQTIMYDPEEAQIRAERARMIVQERCSIERMVEEYVHLYHKLMVA